MLESELKLGVAQQDLEKVLKLPCVRGALSSTPRRRLLKNSYYDTPEFDLRKNGVELRVRHAGREWIQTIKVPHGGLIGLHLRIEIDSPVKGDSPDLTALSCTEVPPMVDSPLVSGRIEKLFETRYWRRRAMLELPDGSLIELNVDSGGAHAGEESLPISEIELELKRGGVGALYEMAELIADGIDARVQSLKKPDLGYRILQNHRPEAVFAKPTELQPGQTAEEVFVALLTESLEHAFANEEAILAGSDIEGVHQMRVGLRRFRSCLSVFKRSMRIRPDQSAENFIKPLLNALGPARDWDVFLGEGFARIERAMAGHRELSAIRKIANNLRKRVYDNLRRLLRSREFHRAKLALVSWIARRAWRNSMSPGESKKLTEPTNDYMKRILRRGDRCVRRQGREIQKRSAKELHRLRITVKKQRYSAEFFQSRFPTGRAGDYAAALKNLQDDLGRLNDGATAATLLEEIGKAPGAKRAAAFVRERAAREHSKALKQLPDCWRRFKEQKRFWK